MTSKDVFLILLGANLPCLGLLILSGWFAYLDNGYWGWPFAIACCTVSGLKSTKERFEEEREIRLQKEDAQTFFNTAKEMLS